MAPAAVGVTTTVIVCEAPAARLPMLSVNTLPVGVSVVLVVVLLADTKVALAGSTSVATTPVAAVVVLLLVTVIV